MSFARETGSIRIRVSMSMSSFNFGGGFVLAGVVMVVDVF
jgi:hypothetical protein